MADGSTRASSTPQVAGEFGFDAVVQTAPGAKHCVVPNVKGEKLAKATSRLKAADCRLGKVTGRGKKVRKEQPKVGTVLPSGSKVKIKLG